MKNHKKDCKCCCCKPNKKYIDKDVLYTKYVTEHKSMKTCGKELNCSPAFVLEYLRKYKIATKPVGKTYNVWGKGETKATNPKLAERGKKVSKAKKGKAPWNKGLTNADPRVKANSLALGKVRKEIFKGENNPFYGKSHTKEWSKAQSIRKGGTGLPGEFNPYGNEFTHELREYIRNRDNYTCQECGKHQKDNNKNKKLEVHHVDYDKNNNIEENLISLCKSCHTATLSNREYWIDKYTIVK